MADSDATPSEKTLDSGTGSRVHTSDVGALTLRSGELARLTGVSADTLRHYERIGILLLRRVHLRESNLLSILDRGPRKR
jgi:hypothetical protein